MRKKGEDEGDENMVEETVDEN
jgi:hypothetical protein